jgi:IclR family pca regulon transcriptional regulator
MIARADFVEGLAKGLAVLECFSPDRQRLNATLVAQRAGLSRAAARRQLLTLEHLGYLEQQDGFFWLTPQVLRLSGVYLSSSRLPQVMQPILDRLAMQLRAGCSTVVLDRAQVVIVARSVAPAPSGLAPARTGRAMAAYGLYQGARLAAHATSTGRVLLAALRPAALREWLAQHGPLQRLTPHTTTEVRRWKAIVDTVRRQDFALASEEHELGVHSVAVALRDMAGQAVAAINVVTGGGGLRSEDTLAETLAALRAAAGEARPLL